MSDIHKPSSETGFSVVEIILTIVIVTILSGAMATAFNNLSRTYALTRQLNEIYSVLSSCPEIDRALQFETMTGTTNCFPNNIFESEGAGTNNIVYYPTMTVNDTSSLGASDPLYNIADSKVVDVSVSRPNSANTSWKIRLLVTRGGIGQQ